MTPKMMPGQEPYTEAELQYVHDLVSGAAEAEQQIDLQELEDHASAARKTIVPTLHALVRDLTPHRATIVLVGSREECNGAWLSDHDAIALIECARPVVGERVWISEDLHARSGLRVTSRANVPSRYAVVPVAGRYTASAVVLAVEIIDDRAEALRIAAGLGEFHRVIETIDRRSWFGWELNVEPSVIADS